MFSWGRDAWHRWWTHNETTFPLIVIHFPIRPFAGRSDSGSRTGRLEEGVDILQSDPATHHVFKHFTVE